MPDTKGFEGQRQRVRRDLSKDGFEPLPQRRRANIDGHRAIRLERAFRVFTRPCPAAFHEACGGKAVIAALDQLSLHVPLLLPTELLEETVEGRMIVAGIVLGWRLIRHELPDR